MSTTSNFHCINVPCNGWSGSRSLSVEGGGFHKKSQINRRMIPIYVTDLFSKTEKNNQNYLLKAEIKNITNCSSQRWDKRFFRKMKSTVLSIANHKSVYHFWCF